MSVAFLFPGQGSQQAGMLHTLPAHPVIAATLDEASTLLGEDLRALDTEAALASSMTVQVTLLIAGVAVTRALGAEGATPDIVAGLSVGAFAAAVGAGALDFRTALHIVRLRGDWMTAAYPRGYGMGALVGLDERQVTQLVEQVSTPASPVFLANINAPRQIVVAGADAAVDAVLDHARAAGAQKAERLHVSVPSHCPLLSPVADRLIRVLAEIPLSPPRVPYVSNRRARALYDPEAIREDLATNVAHPVRWYDANMLMFERGARLFVELPPGRVLTDLAAAEFPAVRMVACADSRLDSIVALIQREKRQT
jgi:malonate decarboxylase epsilon subunit